MVRERMKMRKFVIAVMTGMLAVLAPGIAGVAVRPVRRALLSGCAASTILLGALALSSGAAGASTSPTSLHFFQKETTLTFYNASGQVIQGYPPVGGHVREDDVDYVGNHSHHAKHWSATDHLYCNVVSAPATADCFTEFATGGSLIYADNLSVNLANSGTLAIDGGTGNYAGYSGTYSSTTIGSSNNSDAVLTLHKG
jgi:hypothetical protein